MKESAARIRIVDTASRLFYEQGYNSTGINQIIDEAEIARGSLYNHFPSKRDLLLAYVETASDKWFDALDAFLGGIKSPKRRLLGLFDFRMARQVRTNFGGCQFNKIGAEVPKDDVEAFKLVSRQKDRLKEYISGSLQLMALKDSSLFKKAELVDTLFLLLEGATMEATIYKSAEPMKKARRIAEKFLQQGE